MFFALILALFSTSPALADAQFTLTNNQSGAQYFCSQNGGGGSPDPQCVQEVGDYCKQKTTYTNTQCFEKASAGCANSNAKYPSCVTQTSDYCNVNTSLTNTQCYDKALAACKGSSADIQVLMQSSKAL